MKQLTASAIIAVVLLTAPVFAEYSGGSGTEADPWQISCPNDLLYLGSHPADYNSCFILTADIDLASYTFTTAVIAWPAFTGTFDGNGFVIRNLTIEPNVAIGHLGLFSHMDSGSQIKNLNIEDVNITGRDSSIYIGGLVGSNYWGTINNCYVSGVVVGGDYSYYIGGMVGENWLGTISDCYVVGSVTGGNWSTCFGGLVGNNVGVVNNCYAIVKVSGMDSSDYLGGLAGMSGGIVSSCYSMGTVLGGNGSYGLGGLIGQYESEIINCYATGSVESGNNSYCLGGLVGSRAFQSNGNIVNSYFLDISGPDNGYGEPLTDAQMKQQASFVGWDFVGETVNGTEDIWRMPFQTGYPVLNWQSLNFIDYAVFANAWLSTPADANWNLLCDLKPDNIIDNLDLQIFAEHWLIE